MPIRNKFSPEKLISIWQFLEKKTLGKVLFNKLLGLFAPYSGSIKPRIMTFEPGMAVIEMRDRRAVRNHLRSIHAIALTNLGELTSGLSLLSLLPESARAIVIHIDIDFKKKARGNLIAGSKVEPFQEITENIERVVIATICDADNDVVAEVKVVWLVGPKR